MSPRPLFALLSLWWGLCADVEDGACSAGDGTCASGQAATSGQPCTDQNADCWNWARNGECDKNPGYMLIQCAASCGSCDQLDPTKRCKVTGEEPACIQSGGVQALFDDIMRNDSLAVYQPRLVNTAPPVVVFDSFLTGSEVDAILAVEHNFAPSTGTGPMKADGSFEKFNFGGRTSETAWCNAKSCSEDPVIMKLQARVADVTRVPLDNSEYLQVLKYGPGQKYTSHHDYIPDHERLPCGPRIYTMYMYLSDVEEGGGTKFPRLNLEVKPQKGRAVLWPSVQDVDVRTIDRRTQHEALPVGKGVKYGINAWLHLHDFRTPHLKACTG